MTTLLISDLPAAQTFWHQKTDAGTVFQRGPHLVRSAKITGSTLALTGDNAGSRADFMRVLELDTSGTQYGSMAANFLDILDGLDAAAAAEQQEADQ